MLRERSAGAIVFREINKKREYLLLHYKYKSEYYDFPRGNIEENESEELAAIREVKEEVGLSKVDLISNFKEKIHFIYTRDGEKYFKEITIFLVKCYQENITISSEHIGYVWANFDKALDLLKFKNSKLLIKKAENFLKSRNLNLGDFYEES